jgi:chromosome partitioning protein
MKVIIVSSRKGGAGKTTLSINLAAQACQNGRNQVALLDLDPQGSSLFWASLRTQTKPMVRKCSLGEVSKQLAALAKTGYTHVFLDMPPTDKKALKDALGLADLVIIPTKPSPLDIHSASSTLEWALESAHKVAWVINGASVLSQTPQLVLEQLQNTPARVCKTIVHERNDMIISIGLGLAVHEHAPTSKAAAEIAALWKEVKNLLRN